MAFSFFRRALVGPNRADLLNELIVHGGYRRYVEIGVRDPRQNFEKIRVAQKHGVDPAPRRPISHPMTSDAFFAAHKLDPNAHPYDLSFIDGLHLAEQVERDITNSLETLTENGAVVLHDCNPLTADAQTDDYDDKKHWNGTVWKAWAKLRATRADLAMWVVDMDEGCGVIRRGRQTPISLPTVNFDAMDYALLDSRRREILNLVSLDEFWKAYRADF